MISNKSFEKLSAVDAVHIAQYRKLKADGRRYSRSSQTAQYRGSPPSSAIAWSGHRSEIAIKYLDLVRNLVFASVTYNNNGFQPGLLEGWTI